MKLPPVLTDAFAPAGGQDMVTPPLALANGMAIDARNYECDLEGGYNRVQGYDRYIDGPTPSEYHYQLCALSVISGEVRGGRTLRGTTSNATLMFMTRYEDDDTSHVLSAGMTGVGCYVAEVRGQFVAGELLEPTEGNPASVKLESIPEALPGSTPRESAEERARAEELTRRFMDRPGYGDYITATLDFLQQTAGPILAAVEIEGVPYVFRAVSQTMTSVLPYATVMILKPYPYAASVPGNRTWTPYGFLNRPLDGARFEVVTSNFENPAGPPAIYGVTGTGPAFKFDPADPGLGFAVNIETGMDVDAPEHICVHANRLFLSFKGSVQYSGLNESNTWDPVVGAGEIALGSNITGLMSITGSQSQTALLISTADRLAILYGGGEESFQLIPFSENTGALPGTMQWIGQPVFQNVFGLTRLSASDRFGGFTESTFSNALKPFIDARRGKAVASMVCRSKNQYRIFFDDKTAVYVTFKDGKVIGMFTQKLKHQVTCAWSSVLPDGSELMLIGTEDGGLYRMDVGTSFAGEPIEHYLRLAFNHFRSPRTLKRFIRSILEMRASGYAQIEVGYDIDYGSRERDVTAYESLETPDFGAGGYWDSGNWDEGYWDSATHEPVKVDTRGSGTSLALRIRGNDNISHAINLSGVMVDFMERRKIR